MFHFSLISLTMAQENVSESARYAVAFLASPLSASECGSAKRGHGMGRTQRTVASTMLPGQVPTQLGLDHTGGTADPKGEVLAGGTTDKPRIAIANGLSGLNDGGRAAIGAAGTVGTDADRRSWHRSTNLQQPYYGGLQTLQG